KPMTPYKSMPKWGCDRIEAQERFTHRHSHPLQRLVGDDCGHLFASVRHHLVSWYARRLALAPRAQGGLLGGPSAGRMVGRGSVAALAPTQGRHTPSCGGWQCQTQARDAESLGPKRAGKRAS